MKIRNVIIAAFPVIPTLLFGVILAGPGAVAQQTLPNPALVSIGEDIWKDTAQCRNCHGSMANGVQDIPQEPQGANLRETGLAPLDMEMIIKCGIPNDEMPYFDAHAYSDGRCYGMDAAANSDDIPPAGSPFLSQRQVDAIVSFLYTNFVGKGEVTREECEAFWGDDASTCPRYRTAAEVAAGPPGGEVAPAPAQ